MEQLLKEALNISNLSVLGQFGGYIAKDAAGYEIDGGKRIFTKTGVGIILSVIPNFTSRRAC